MINYLEAEKLLRKYIGNQLDVYKHSKAVSDFLYETCIRLNKLHPELRINLERMKIIGLLHDIGKKEGKKDIFHAMTGGIILEKEGLKEIAKIVRTHGIAKELSEIENIKGYFEPENLEEELLTYADVHVKGDKVVSFDERYKEILERSKETQKEARL